MGMGVTPPQIPGYPGLLIPPPVVPVLVPGPSTMAHVITPMGPGMLSPAIVIALTALYTELIQPNAGAIKKLPFSGAPFNSLDAFVGMSNEDTLLLIEKNEFKTGEQIKTENNKWKLTDDYYTVV
jgi:hypothetical protein